MSGSRGSYTPPTRDRHPAQWLTLAVGLAFVLAGIAGFAMTGFDGFAAPDGELLLGIFEVNPLHNLVHLLIGLAGTAMWVRLGTARTYGWLLAIGYGATFAYGLVVADSSDRGNFLAVNGSGNWLHVTSAALGLAIALWPTKDATDWRRPVPPSKKADDHRRSRH